MVWPTSRFFWAVLDTPSLRPGRELPQGVLAVFQESVPVDVEGLHAIGVPEPGGRTVVCAAYRAELAPLTDRSLSLTPDTLPPFLDGLGLSSASFNLLVCAFEPRAVRRARARYHLLAAAILVCIGVLVAFGLQRRAVHWDKLAVSLRAASSQVAAETDARYLPADLARESERLREINTALNKEARPTDASLAVAERLRAWPGGVASRPDSISADATAVTVSVAVDGSPSEFLGV